MGKVKPDQEWKFKCANTGKALKRKKRYYRNGKYYISKAAFQAQAKKEAEAKVAAEQAQYERLLKTREYAAANIPLQVRKYQLELEEARQSSEQLKTAWTNARKWTVAAVANFDFGIGPARDIFEGLQNYARMKGEYFQALYNFRIARANLQLATGELPGATQ